MSAARPVLKLVPVGIKKLAIREQLIAQSRKHFPHNGDMAAKWVEAKLVVWEQKPTVEIGIQRIDTSRTVRALPVGSVSETLEIPSFLRRFVKR